MDSVSLTPRGSLVFAERPGDWRENLFDLAALQDRSQDEEPAIRFWRIVGESFIFALCRWTDRQTLPKPPPPAERKLNAWVEGAPPMRGGEYLSEELIVGVWADLADWVAAQIGEAKNLPDFLASRAPKWQMVGRVTFNLAENKSDPIRPFAFMATYVTGLDVAGGERHLPLSQALRQSAGERDRSSLLQLLTPVLKASERLKWVDKMVKDDSIYRPSAFSVKQAHQFLLDVPQLEEAGLYVRVPNWWRKRSYPQVKISLGEKNVSRFGLKALLDWNVSLTVGENTLTEEEIREIFDSKEPLVFFKGQWLEVDQEKLREALDRWTEAQEDCRDGVSFIEAMRLLAGYPVSIGDGKKEELGSSRWIMAEAGEGLAELLKEIRSPKAAEVPSELKAVLRGYQETGLSWLSLLSGLGLGACLADDMGLGKTMQILALLLLDRKRRNKNQPSLLVAPASLLSNWRLEANRFAPDLKLSIFHPSFTPKDKIARWEKNPDVLLNESELVITSYAFLARRVEFFAEKNWRMMIVDEAQAIKNPVTAQSRAVRKIKAHARLALTGTPIENRLLDIWALFDFLNPGLLGSAQKFKKAVDELSTGGADQYAPIRRLLAPYLLRRLKTDKSVISDLPDKTETTVHCALTKEQAKIYAKVVEALEKSLSDLDPDEKDQIRRKGLVLRSLTQLKQLCNHPAQLIGDMDWTPERSGKFIRVAELTREMAERQDKVLVFTQYQEIIAPLESYLAEVFGRPGVVIHGGTPVKKRQGLVDEFQKDDGPPFFILSLKAGGTGLNLTAASHVIHFDRWWNPAVEDQATDRAYRVGQKKNVLVHKCVTLGTLEEKIDLTLREKRGLAQEILGQGQEINLLKLSDKALIELVSLDLDRAVF